MSPSAITRLLFGEATSDDTVIAVADVLGLAPERVWELHGAPRPNPFVLGREADRLSPTQRAAVRAVVVAMLEGKVEAQPRLRAVARRKRGGDPNEPIS